VHYFTVYKVNQEVDEDERMPVPRRQKFLKSWEHCPLFIGNSDFASLLISRVFQLLATWHAINRA